MMKLVAGLATGLFVFGMVGHASAIMVTVDWSADVTPNSSSPSPGQGTLSGSLGTFDVTGVSDTFDFAPDGSIDVVASGFVESLFLNGTYFLTRETVRPFQLEFTSVGFSASDFAVNIVDTNAGLLSPYSFSDTRFVALFDKADTGEDIALASLGEDGSINDESHGLIQYSFTVDSAPVPEPATMLIFGTGLVGLVGSRIRKMKK